MVKELSKVEINETFPEAILLTYGTLRLNQPNYRHLLEGNSEYLGEFITSPDFVMFGKHSGFPIVCDGGDIAIKCDVFRVTDNDVLQNVHRLEGCTGIPSHPSNWYDIMPIDTPYGQGWMYIQHEEFNSENIIHSGDWLNK